LGDRTQYLFLPGPLILVAIFLMASARTDRELSLREKVTIGTIVAHEPRNHDRYGYRFEVSGREYSGWETPFKAEPRIGSSVTVYYDPLSPSESALADFSERGHRKTGMAIALFVLSTVAIAATLFLG
jgi:hypothetical protein